MDLVDLQRTGQRAGIRQTTDPAAREDTASDIPAQTIGSVAQLLIGSHQDGLGDRKAEPRYQPLAGPLVMQ